MVCIGNRGTVWFKNCGFDSIDTDDVSLSISVDNHLLGTSVDDRKWAFVRGLQRFHCKFTTDVNMGTIRQFLRKIYCSIPRSRGICTELSHV